MNSNKNTTDNVTPATTLDVAEAHQQATETRLKLLENGWRPLPLVEKRCFVTGWPIIDITPDVINGWPQGLPRTLENGDRTTMPAVTTGIQLTDNMLAIDIDVDGEEQADALLKIADAYVGKKGWVRHSGGAKVMVLMRTEKPHGVWRSPTYVDGDGKDHCIEVFGSDTTRYFGVYGPHTLKKGKDGWQVVREYDWYEGLDPLTATLADLPVISHDDFVRMFRDLQDHLDSVEGWTEDESWKCGYLTNRVDYDLTEETVFLTEQGEMTWAEAEHYAATDRDPRCAGLKEWGSSQRRKDRCQFRLFDGMLSVFDYATYTEHRLEGTEDAYRPSLDDLAAKPAALADAFGSLGGAWGDAIAAVEQREMTISDFAEVVAEKRDDPDVEPDPDLLTFAQMQDLPGVEWAIKGVLPANGVAAIYGAWGTGKTFAALDMTLEIASGGEAWFGRRVKQRPVVYVPFEGFRGITPRLQAWSERRGRDIPDAFRVDRKASVRLNNEDSVKAFIARIVPRVPKGAIVVLDTLALALGGSDENDAADTSAAINMAYEIAKATEGLVVLVHHAGKDASKGMRGSSALEGNVDTIIKIALDEKLPRVHHWSIRKQKDGDPTAMGSFKLLTVKVGVDEDGDDITSCTVEPYLMAVTSDQSEAMAKMVEAVTSPHNGVAYRALEEDDDEAWSFDEMLEIVKPALQEQFDNITTKNRASRAKQAIERLQDAGLIVDPDRVGRFELRALEADEDGSDEQQ